MQTTPSPQTQSGAQNLQGLVALWQAGNWDRVLKMTESVFRPRSGTPADRSLLLLMRCEAARRLHNPREFARSLAAYQKERTHLKPQERELIDRMAAQGFIRTYYQNPKFKRRPEFVMSGAAVKQRGLDPAALDQLRRNARTNLSEALYVWHNGAVIVEEHFDAPQEPVGIMSVTKPVTAMAIGRLLDIGKLKSLDQPVSDFYPQWKADEQRRKITLRHLLTHTGGLQQPVPKSEAEDNAEMIRIFADLLTFALEVPIIAEPGTQWEYSNAAFYLLADIVRKVSGKRVDAFVKAEFFDPMGIVDWDWSDDPKGTIEGAGGLGLRAHDLAKIGILILDGGTWKGKRLLSESFVKESLRDKIHDTTPGGINIPNAPHLGLAWFLQTEPQKVFTSAMRTKWKEAKVPEAQIAKMLSYLDKPMPEAAYTALVKRLYGVQGPDDLAGWRKALGFSGFLQTADDAPSRVTAFFHTGQDGQYLTVFPQQRLVAVRQVLKKNLSDRKADGDYQTFNYDLARLTGKVIWTAKEG